MNTTVKPNSKENSTLVRPPLFGAMDEASAIALMEAATLMTFPSRHMLFREGDAAEHLYYVLSGHVRLFCTGKDGREADVSICGPGETFNACLIFGADRHRYSAQTAASCTLARLELVRFRSMVETNPKIARSIMQCLAESALTAMECVANDRLQTAPQRVAHYLATHGQQNKTSYVVRLPFQKSVLAGKLGLAPEALSRAFSTLKDYGVIVRGRMIHVNDAAALKQI